jgi:hypothetical protein
MPNAYRRVRIQRHGISRFILMASRRPKVTNYSLLRHLATDNVEAGDRNRDYSCRPRLLQDWVPQDGDYAERHLKYDEVRAGGPRT